MSDKKTQIIGQSKAGGAFYNATVDSSGNQNVIDDNLNTKITSTNTKLDTLHTDFNDLNINTKNLIKKTYDFTSDQTAQTLWTPTLDYWIITDLFISAVEALIITVFDNSDTTANRICKFNLVAGGGAVINFRKPIKSSGANFVLKFTTISTSNSDGYITAIGYETD